MRVGACRRRAAPSAIAASRCPSSPNRCCAPSPGARPSSRRTGVSRAASSRSTIGTSATLDASYGRRRARCRGTRGCATLWQDAAAADAVPAGACLRTPAQVAHAWNRIVAAQAAPLIDARGASALAADAWSLVHAWGAGGESWRGWAGTGDADDDPAAFARWANRYAAALADSGSIDPAQLPDLLSRWAPRVPAWRGTPVVLAGFIEFAPQQERLLAALAAAGADVVRADTLSHAPGRAWRTDGATPHDEIALALSWARDRAIGEPGATIGIVVEDLALRRDEIRALADDVLCPALQWPGELASPRPYNLSLGVPLSEAPLVAAALDLIGWAHSALPVGRAAALLRSPHVASGADPWMRRARLERDWLLQGRRDITTRAAVGALRNADRALGERWAQALDRHRLPAAGTPRAFAEASRGWLDALGWPGGRAPESAEFQARRAWDEALASFATLGAVEGRLSRADALAALRAHMAAKIFQPESPPAAIEIVGVLEAAGSPSMRCGSPDSRRSAGRRRRGPIRCCRSPGSASATCHAHRRRASSPMRER